MREVAVGIDVGTGSSKVGLLARDGRLLAVARRPHVIDHPRAGWAESDPAGWVAAVRAALDEVLAAVPDAEVATIGLSGQMHGVVPCRADGTPTRPAVLWSDRRAAPSMPALVASLRDHDEVLGNPLVPGMTGPILAALTREEPAAIDVARWALPAKDWLRLVATGDAATDPSDASGTLLWDVAADGWSSSAIAACGIRPGLLPPVRGSGERAGVVTPEGAATLRLPPGVPVATGAADTAAALLGAGVAPGSTQIATGTGGQVARVVGEPRTDPTRRTHLFRAAEPDRWYAMAAMQNVGVALDWALGVLGAERDEVDRAVATVAPGADGVTFVPYLTGERTPHLDAGLTAAWRGLRADTTREAMLRAVVEGIAFTIRDGVDALRAAGHAIEEATLVGGGSAAPWWRQLLADALGLPLVPLDVRDASVRGAALLGWAALGADVAREGTPRRGERLVPSPGRLEPALDRFREVVATDLRAG